MVKFILVRHGFSMGNKEKKFSGQMDVPLDEAGLRQAESVSEYIYRTFKVDKIYSSDLCRAFDTVKPLAKALNIEIIKAKAFREVDVGLWQGRLIEDVKKEYPESFRLYKEKPGIARFDGGETYGECQKRALDEIEKIAKENDGKTIVIGTHGGVVRNLRAAFTKTPLESTEAIPHVPNASITVAEYQDGKFTLEIVGLTDYLTDKPTEEGVK